MALKQIPLNEPDLKSNYNYWINKLTTPITVPKEEITSILQKKICTTHSFPFTKQLPIGEVIPYETIFSDVNNGILSNGFRELASINADDDKSNRNIPDGLKNYVFSYLGIHQPYYARMQSDKIGLLSKPFGVFIKSPDLCSNTEKFPRNHASRRDIGKENEEVDQSKIHLEYLLSNDARRLIAHQICNDKDHIISNKQIDCFWHYYGTLNHWKDSDYATNSWKKKAEFRFFEKLELSEIGAILWPIWIDEIDETTEVYSKTHEDLQVYSMKHPNIKFITYDLDLRDPEICFIEASQIALQFLLENDIFPENISIAKNTLGNKI